VLVSEWMDGTPLSRIISDGTQEERDRAGIMLVRFLFSGPARTRLLHADPHPGNFRLLQDGRLGVLDFGAVDRLPNGFPPFFGKVLWLMHTDGDPTRLERELRDNGFLRPGMEIDLGALRAFLAPLAEPSNVETFKFSREWMRSEAARMTDMRAANVSRRLNLPPSYVLIHRVSTAGIGVLCQLECEGPFRAEVLKWMPGYGESATLGRPEDAGSDGPQDARADDRSDSPRVARTGPAKSTARSGPAKDGPRSGPAGGAGGTRPAQPPARLHRDPPGLPGSGRGIRTLLELRELIAQPDRLVPATGRPLLRALISSSGPLEDAGMACPSLSHGQL